MELTVAVAITLAVAVAGGFWRVWAWHKSGPGLRVEGHATWIPEQFMAQTSPGTLRPALNVFEVIVRNAGERNAAIEAWGFESRDGTKLYPPCREWERVALAAPLSCPASCQSKAGGHAHRWYVPEDYLLDWCDLHRVRVDDVRPWVRRGSDGKVVSARRWGLANGDVLDEPPRARWIAGRRRRAAWSGSLGYWPWRPDTGH